MCAVQIIRQPVEKLEKLFDSIDPFLHALHVITIDHPIHRSDNDLVFLHVCNRSPIAKVFTDLLAALLREKIGDLSLHDILIDLVKRSQTGKGFYRPMKVFTNLVELANVQKPIPELPQNSETEAAENSDSCCGIIFIILIHQRDCEMACGILFSGVVNLAVPVVCCEKTARRVHAPHLH